MSLVSRTPRQPWPIDAAEATAIAAIQKFLRPKWTIRAAQAISFIAEHAIAWLALCTVLFVLNSEHRIDWAVLALAIAVAHLGSSALKVVIRRPRPSDPRVAVLGKTLSPLSFPSSHAANTAAFWAGVAVLFPELSVAAVCGILLMALARIRLGVHYPTDVLTGILIGVCCATLALAW